MIQPSSAFMERAFSILRACLDERQESCYSDRIRASALFKYNRGRKERDALPCTAVLYTLVILRCGFSSLCLIYLVFQYYCSGVDVERVRGTTVSLGAVGPREFDLLAHAAQHQKV